MDALSEAVAAAHAVIADVTAAERQVAPIGGDERRPLTEFEYAIADWSCAFGAAWASVRAACPDAGRGELADDALLAVSAAWARYPAELDWAERYTIDRFVRPMPSDEVKQARTLDAARVRRWLAS